MGDVGELHRPETQNYVFVNVDCCLLFRRAFSLFSNRSFFLHIFMSDLFGAKRVEKKE